MLLHVPSYTIPSSLYISSPGAPSIAVSQGNFLAGAGDTESKTNGHDGEKTPPPMLNDAQSRHDLSPEPETPLGAKATGIPASPAPTQMDSLPPNLVSGNSTRPAKSGTTKDSYYFKMHGST